MTRAPGQTRHDAHRGRTGPQYLLVACELANASADAPSSHYFAVAHVSIADVARAAGVSRGALYRIWPSQSDFWNDLTRHILGAVDDDHSRPGAPDERPAPDGVIGEIPLLSLMDLAQDVLLSDPLPLLRAGVVGYPRSAVRGPTDARGATMARGDLHRRVHADLEGRGLRCVDGLTPSDLATAITILGNGLPITGRMVPDDDLSLDSTAATATLRSPRTLLGAAAAAVVNGFTQPAGQATPRLATALPNAVCASAIDTVRFDDAPAAMHRRLHYLRIAASLALDGRSHVDPQRVLGHVTLDALAREASVTRRTLTNVWPDQAAFRLDLFSHLVERERQWIADAIDDTIRDEAPHTDARTALRAVGDRIHQHVVAHVDEVSSLAYAPLLEQYDVAERALDDHAQHVDRCARQLRRFLVAIGRRRRPGVSLRHLATVLFTYTDGLNRFARTHGVPPATGSASRGATHTLTGYATAAILEEMTEPLEDRERAMRLSRLLS